MADTMKVEIGFVGGGTTSAVLTDKVLAALTQAVEKAQDGLVELDSDGGSLFVRPTQIAFLRVLQRESRVGF